jgi:hypothetical protein
VTLVPCAKNATCIAHLIITHGTHLHPIPPPPGPSQVPIHLMHPQLTVVIYAVQDAGFGMLNLIDKATVRTSDFPSHASSQNELVAVV